MPKVIPCPHCGGDVVTYRNPVPTVDVVIYHPVHGVVLVERKNYPAGWALPGGFIDYGEPAEKAARREALEETGLEVSLTGLLGVYSDPRRDSRQHTLSVVYTATPFDPGKISGGDDARQARFFGPDDLPDEFAFDHARILDDFLSRIGRLNF